MKTFQILVVELYDNQTQTSKKYKVVQDKNNAFIKTERWNGETWYNLSLLDDAFFARSFPTNRYSIVSVETYEEI